MLTIAFLALFAAPAAPARTVSLVDDRCSIIGTKIDTGRQSYDDAPDRSMAACTEDGDGDLDCVESTSQSGNSTKPKMAKVKYVLGERGNGWTSFVADFKTYLIIDWTARRYVVAAVFWNKPGWSFLQKQCTGRVSIGNASP